MSLKTAVKMRVNVAKWILGGKNKYLAETPFLSKPQLSGNAELDRNLIELYEKGVTVTSGFAPTQSISDVLTGMKKEFAEAIEMFKKSAEQGKQIDYVDARRWKWLASAPEGILQCHFDDPTHPLYEKIYDAQKSAYQKEHNLATIEELLTKFPALRSAVENETVQRLAHYANDGDARPITIKIERKTFTMGDNYNRIHFDTYTGTFKTYLYLNDVTIKSGAFAYAEGSHHWKMYPQMLFEVMAKTKKLFTLEDLQRYGLKPFTYAVLPAGSLFCFSGNIIHSATNVEQGERWSVQIYYYTQKPWSTDKALNG